MQQNQFNTSNILQEAEPQAGSNQACSQVSMQEEYCQTHGDLYVAFDKKKDQLVCNQCIYADTDLDNVNTAMEQLTFTSYVAGNLKELFDEKFAGYKAQLQAMGKIAPQAISQTLETTVSQFFMNVDKQINNVEASVLEKISASTNLHELEQILEREKDSFGLNLESTYEASRLEIEGRVKQGQFSQVVGKKDQYEDLISKMHGNQESMTNAVEAGQKRIERIMTIKQGAEAQANIGKRLREIVDSCLEIDIRKDEISNFKRPKTVDHEAERQADFKRAQMARFLADEERKRNDLMAAQNQRIEDERLENEKLAEAKRRQEEHEIVLERQRQQHLAQQNAMVQAEQERQVQLQVQRTQEETQQRLAQEESRRQHFAAEQARQDQLRAQHLAQQCAMAHAEKERQKAQAQAAQQAQQEEANRLRMQAEDQARRMQEDQVRRQQDEEARRVQHEENMRQERLVFEEMQRKKAAEEEAAHHQRLATEAAARQADQLRIAEAARVELQRKADDEAREQTRLAEVAEMERLQQRMFMEQQLQQQRDEAERQRLSAEQEMIRQQNDMAEKLRLQQEAAAQQESERLRIQQEQTQQNQNQPIVMASDPTMSEPSPSPPVVEQPPQTIQIMEMDNRISEEVRHPEVLTNLVEPHSDEQEHQMVSLFDSVPPPVQPVLQQPMSECDKPHLSVGENKCSCGNTYAEDSDFCRMCGSQRQRDVQMQEPIVQPVVQEEQVMQPLVQEPAPIQEFIPQSAPVLEPVLCTETLAKDPAVYCSFYKQSSMSISKQTPMMDFTYKNEEIFKNNKTNLLSRCVSLPGNRVFVIGGASTIDCESVYKNTYEYTNGEMVEKAPMWTGRAGFGCAVYPNFSQIFIAGGSINKESTTKQCERYIVAQNVWKRLPELRQSRFQTSLCFFNNGGTLYCFGGLERKDANMFNAIDTVERLSKGQNTWALLSLRMPSPMFDMGTISLNATNEIVLFGGFKEGAVDQVIIYKTDAGSEGEFARAYHGPERSQTKLQDKDFFVVNGVYIKGSSPNNIVVAGHQHLHCLDTETKTFTTMKQQ